MGCPDRKDTEFSDLSRSGGSLFASASGVRSGGVPAVLGGSILPLFLLAVLYYFRMLGAGDIKLFCAIGGLMGEDP